MTFTWPVLGSQNSATVFWGWAQIVLGLLNFLILGVLFFFDAIPYARRRDYHSALFGWTFCALSITSGAHALMHGYYTINRELTPYGVKPLDIASLVMCFGPMPLFGIQRWRAYTHRPDWIVQGTPLWMLLITCFMGFYTGAFVQRFVDGVRVHHIEMMWTRFDSYYNLILTASYFSCAYLWLRWQLKLRRITHVWSVSGLSLGLIFVSMAFHRLAQAIEVAGRQYTVRSGFSALFFWVDLASIAAALFFLGFSMSLLAPTGPKITAEESPAAVGD